MFGGLLGAGAAGLRYGVGVVAQVVDERVQHVGHVAQRRDVELGQRVAVLAVAAAQDGQQVDQEVLPARVHSRAGRHVLAADEAETNEVKNRSEATSTELRDTAEIRSSTTARSPRF